MGAVFRAGISSIDSLAVGAPMPGNVSNVSATVTRAPPRNASSQVTDFGAFVDIGCGRDGLIPRSTLPKKTDVYEVMQVCGYCNTECPHSPCGRLAIGSSSR